MAPRTKLPEILNYLGLFGFAFLESLLNSGFFVLGLCDVAGR